MPFVLGSCSTRCRSSEQRRAAVGAATAGRGPPHVFSVQRGGASERGCPVRAGAVECRRGSAVALYPKVYETGRRKRAGAVRCHTLTWPELLRRVIAGSDLRFLHALQRKRFAPRRFLPCLTPPASVVATRIRRALVDLIAFGLSSRRRRPSGLSVDGDTSVRDRTDRQPGDPRAHRIRRGRDRPGHFARQVHLKHFGTVDRISTLSGLTVIGSRVTCTSYRKVGRHDRHAKDENRIEQANFDAIDAEVEWIAREPWRTRPALPRTDWPRVARARRLRRIVSTLAAVCHAQCPAARRWCLSPAVCYHVYDQLAGRDHD